MHVSLILAVGNDGEMWSDGHVLSSLWCVLVSRSVGRQAIN